MVFKPFNAQESLRGSLAEWYETEKNTATLLKAVLKSLKIPTLSGDDLWSVLRLTWITTVHGNPTPDHWKRLKVPALAELYHRSCEVLGDLPATLKRLDLPLTVTEAAAPKTGFVNFRNVWRNSCRTWCTANKKALIGIVTEAMQLPANDQARYELAKRIGSLSAVPSPDEKSSVGAPAVLTPVVACLDPWLRFPVINGRGEIGALLRSLKLADGDLQRQVKGITSLVGQFGIEDALTVDVLADVIAKHIPKSLPAAGGHPSEQQDASDLPYLDEAEREATRKSQSVTYRNRHNKITNTLRELLRTHKLSQGTRPDSRYAVLVKNYDQNGRDLLIEVKS